MAQHFLSKAKGKASVVVFFLIFTVLSKKNANEFRAFRHFEFAFELCRIFETPIVSVKNRKCSSLSQQLCEYSIEISL